MHYSPFFTSTLLFPCKTLFLRYNDREGGITLEEYAEVVKTRGDKATVRIRRHAQCKKCTLCSGDKELMVEANNPLKAEAGQVVLLQMASSRILGASFLIYIFPLLMILLGYLLGSSLVTTRTELVGFITGMAFLLLSLLVIRFMDSWLGERWDYKPTIKQIIGGRMDEEVRTKGRGDGV